jgi:hypothetical protein
MSSSDSTSSIPSMLSSGGRPWARTEGHRVNLHDHLLAAEEGIANELARSQRDGLLAVRHLERCEV